MTSKNSFIELNLPETLSTGYSDPNAELFTPVLSHASSFDVAVGYFSSTWLRDVSDGIFEFAKNGGKSRWIISPELQPEDAKIISSVKASDDPTELTQLVTKLITTNFERLNSSTQDALATLIKYGALEFKIAIPKKSGLGMFHAKIGVARDWKKDYVAFNGSYNLTGNAKSNWEHIDIFKSWNTAEAKRTQIIRNRFENLWSNQDPSFDIYKPSADLLKQISSRSQSTIDSLCKSEPQEEKCISLRDYQIEAINCWGEAHGRGFLVMATGSGKTITALSIVKKLIDERTKPQSKKLFVCFILPLKHLLDQWYEESEVFGFKPIKCYENSTIWREKLADSLVFNAARNQGITMAMVTNSTFITDSFQSLINNVSGDFLIVADEAHNLGAPTYSSKLPRNANFRLALSATPMRHNDEEGTDTLFNYFGKSVFEFSLADAIEAGYLVPYTYTPLLCEMTEQEFYLYHDLTEQIELEQEKRRPGQPRSSNHDKLLRQRNELVSMVENKLELLAEHLGKLGSIKHTLIYCGTHRDGEGLRHIDRVVKLVGNGLGYKNRKFTAEESTSDRQEILRLFASGELDIIAAIKCLDEGVDVPATQNAFILSSTANPREFIQRRGRVLRRSPGKESAQIFDFIVVPPKNAPISPSLVSREVFRALEYNSLSINFTQNDKFLRELAEKHGVELDG